MYNGDFLCSGEIKTQETKKNMESKDLSTIPTIDDLKICLQDIFELCITEDIATKGDISESTSFTDSSSCSISLEDGTIITLPKQSDNKKEADNTERFPNTDIAPHETKFHRELTEEEKNDLKKTLGWTDKQIAKCTIDETGVIHYKTDREDMEGKTGPNGVPYEHKTVDIHGTKVEGVFPVFDSVCDVQLSEDLEKASNPRQFKECNMQLKEKIKTNAELRNSFSEEQLEEIEDGDTPSGYVWHHNEETGKMQLVKVEDHDRTQGGAAHTGGKALWGGSYSNSEISIVDVSDMMAQKVNNKEVG